MNEAATLAVIVPVRNEQSALPLVLASLRKQTEPAERVLVVDAGSLDRSVAVAREHGADVLVSARAGRGFQIAGGVEAVSESIILIAHADMLFPPEALARTRRYLALHPACPGGCLGHRFDSPRWLYRVIEWFDRRRGRSGWSYGDQAQFVRREALALVGGFPAQEIMEDVELTRRLRKLGRMAYLDYPVMVSPRRFERDGIARTVWRNCRFRAAYRRSGVKGCRAIFESYYSRATAPP